MRHLTTRSTSPEQKAMESIVWDKDILKEWSPRGKFRHHWTIGSSGRINGILRLGDLNKEVRLILFSFF